MKNRRAKSRRRGNLSLAERRERRSARHILDVKVKNRRDKKKRTSPRSVFWVKGLIVVMAVATIFIAVHSAARAYLIDNPEYRLKLIAYETDGVLSRQRVLDYLELETGGKLLEIDMPALREKLLAKPEIKSAQLQRDLPDKITISVNERSPIAWLACRSRGVVPKTVSREDLKIRGLMVDETGIILECRRLMPRYVALPVIKLRDLGETTPGRRIQPAEAMSAVDLIKACDEALYLDSLKVREIELATEYSLLASFNSGAEVTFGMSQLEKQVEDFRLIHQDSLKKGRRLGSVNLLMKKNIPVRFIETSQNPTPEEVENLQPIPAPRARPAGEESGPEPRRTPKIRRSIPRERADNADGVRAYLRTG
ncbi:MAG: FtsQ-type POTRA domain-containing protein [Verrucomicrobiota bacterium]